MKIAVFGDSFADTHLKNPTPSWVQHLGYKYDVTNFACGGSSLFYSMSLFEKHHFSYDRVIFVITNPGRLLLPDWPCFDNIYQRMIPSPVMAEIMIEDFSSRKLTSSILKNRILIWQAALDYYKYIQFDDHDIYFHNLMFDRLTRLRPDAIIIPTSRRSHFSFANKTSMCDIQLKENLAWGITDHAKTDVRNSHMTIRNNEIFAEKVIDWLNGGVAEINLDDFISPSMEEKAFYFKDSKGQ